MNNSNLIPFNEMSTEKHKELSRSGGIASGKARKEKRTMKECLLTMLYDIKPTKAVDELLDEFNVSDDEYKTNAMAICMVLSIVAIRLSLYSISLNKKQTTVSNSNGKVAIQGDELEDAALVGTYRGTWNGKDATLVLFENYTMIHPNNYRGTWHIEEGEVVLNYNYSSFKMDKDGLYIRGDDGNFITEEKPVEHSAVIVDKGLLLVGKFFQKI